MIKRVNTIKSHHPDLWNVHLDSKNVLGVRLMFALLLVDFDFVLSAAYKRHITTANPELYNRPRIYMRMLLAIQLGYNRQQIALLIGNGWTIRINSLIRLGFATPSSEGKEKWEQLVLTDKGLELYNDVVSSVERYLNGLEQPIPWPEYKKRGLNKRLAPKQKENK